MGLLYTRSQRETIRKQVLVFKVLVKYEHTVLYMHNTKNLQITTSCLTLHSTFGIDSSHAGAGAGADSIITENRFSKVSLFLF